MAPGWGAIFSHGLRKAAQDDGVTCESATLRHSSHAIMGYPHLSHFVMTDSSLSELFQTHFEILPAEQAHMQDIVFRIRHQVYCEELGYEPHRANQLEQDDFDKNAIHCLLLHKPSQTYAGCVRLILSDSQAPELNFPFEQVCGKSLCWTFDNSGDMGRKKYGEISRLAVTAPFRRARHGAHTAHSGGGPPGAGYEEVRRLFPSVALGLYLASTAMGLSKGLDGVFAMMEPRLARQLRFFGIQCQQVGEAVEHRGTRVPYFICSQALLGNLKLECRTLLGRIQDGLTVPQVAYA